MILMVAKLKEQNVIGGKVKVKTVVVIFSIVDQLLTRSFGLEKLPINKKT